MHDNMPTQPSEGGNENIVEEDSEEKEIIDERIDDCATFISDNDFI